MNYVDSATGWALKTRTAFTLCFFFFFIYGYRTPQVK